MKRKYFPTDEELAVIQENYDGSHLMVNKIMRVLGRKYPRWYVKRVAARMGLARIKEKNWSSEEEKYISERWPRMGVKALRAGLRHEFGVLRSTTAIQLRIKHFGILREQANDGFTFCGLENILFGGRDLHRKMSDWIERGWLKGKRRGTLRKKSQGGDMWYFSPEHVRSFIVRHPTELDLRRVDPVVFIGLVAGDKPLLVACRCPGCGREYERRLYNPGIQTPRLYCDACKERMDDLHDEE